MNEPELGRTNTMKRTVLIEGQECALLPLTKGKFAVVDADMFDELSKREWYYHRKGYAAGGSGRILMHRVIAETPDSLYTDHENGNKLDNRRTNLRLATNAENRSNSLVSRNNRLGVKGVTATGRRFAARICHNKKIICVGTFDTIEQASAARASALKGFHGEFAKLP